MRWSAHQSVASSLTAIGACSRNESDAEDRDDVEGESRSVYGRAVDGEMADRCDVPVMRHAVELNRPSRRRALASRYAWLSAAAIIIFLAGGWWWQSARIPVGSHVNAVAQPQSRPSGVICVDSGTLRLPLLNVGSVVVEGPARFELERPKRMRVDLGRIRVEVTEPSGYGFVVATPHGEVTDLGTEFGIDVNDSKTSDIVVFEGQVDLRAGVPGRPGALAERLVGGDAVSFASDGQLSRIMSISTDGTATFMRLPRISTGTPSPLISNVSDRLKNTKRFYEIVPGGFREDVLAYVDRKFHNWNGVDARGLPSSLVGADYVKTFNSDKLRSKVEIAVEVARPARLFVFIDDRIDVPTWLKDGFKATGDKIGLDAGDFVASDQKKSFLPTGVGPGKSLDAVFSVWERRVMERGIVLLGPIPVRLEGTAMYGIAAVEMQSNDTRQESQSASGTTK
ncbi:MAG: FecR domain-containing protein [Pirellulales bacterium]|nr:FecR domain-containing protein [Pirellulales bacterium]